MSESQKPSEKTVAKKTSFFRSPAHLLVLAVVFLVLLISGIYLQQHRPTEPSNTNNGASATTSDNQNLSMSSTNLNPQPGEVVEISVWEDSGSKPVNAVQTGISYPTDKFSFVSSSGSKSAFEVQAQNSNKDGKIVIARGHNGSLNGQQLVAVISLKTKNSPGSATLTFNDDTHLVSSETNQDILKQSNDITFSIGN